ncbi:MAG: alpha/beta hydrolase [Defluviitaleaceae bacterium]|nr:alpha/beta hydrolase [Defluviitaleaceae bacterium]
MAFYEHNGKKIHYEVYGEGVPIVLLNGVMMSTLSWKMFIPALSKTNKLILMDYFDQGQSDKLSGVEYDQSLQVAAMKGLFEHLGLERVNLAGISYGGNVSLQFAAKHPEMVEKLMIFHAVPYTNDWLRAIGKSWIASIDDPHNFYNTAIPVIYSPEFYNNNTRWVEERKELLTTQVFTNMDFMEAVVRLTKSADNHDVRDVLGKITARTLIVAADPDPLTPAAEQKALKQAIPGAQWVLLPDCGHASMYEKPTLFVTLVLGFINSDFQGL